MQRYLAILLLVLVAGPFLAVLLPAGLDECDGSACDPIHCAASCPLCTCTLDRDRLVPEAILDPSILEPTADALALSLLRALPTRSQDILHVPKSSLA
jgi:hypothetical protein